MSAKPLLAVEGLSISAGPTVLLRDVSFALDAGETLTVVGESGAGKSLLAQAVMGSLHSALCATGRVTLAGTVSAANDRAARRPRWGREIALLPQEPSLALDPLQRVGAQIEEVHRLLLGSSRQEAKTRATEDLVEVGLQSAARRYPWQVSGGMAQRAVATIALRGGASIVLADEPTRGLDAFWRDRTVDSLRRTRERGGCVVTITHDLRVAAAMGGTIVVLLQGEVVEAGTTADVLASPRHVFTRELLAAQPENWPRFASRPRGAEVLAARDLSKDFGDGPLFADIDLDIRRGSRLAVQGPSGTGKSTLGNVLLRLTEPDTGSVHRGEGLAVTRFQKLYQDPVSSFAPRATLGVALRDTSRLHGKAWNDMLDLLDVLRIPESLLSRRPHEVSGGELQRVALARVLSVAPAFVFADEPTSRLDLRLQKDALALMIAALDRIDAALLLVTHDDDIASAVAEDRIRLKHRDERENEGRLRTR